MEWRFCPRRGRRTSVRTFFVSRFLGAKLVKTEDINVLSSALCRKQSAGALVRAALRLWLYVGCLALEFVLLTLLRLCVKVGSVCCCVPSARGYDRIGDPDFATSSPIGLHVPFVYTDYLRVTRDSEGRKILNSYLILQTLDTGSSGKVKLAVDINTRAYYALKKYNKVILKKKKLGLQRNEYENVIREIRILEKLKHPNIVNLFEVINDEEDDYIYLVMEYLSGGSVLSKQQSTVSIDEATARNYFVDVAYGLEYLHLNHVIHRDIKPDNIVLTGDGRVAKICDFSVSHEFEDNDDRLSSSAGAPAFLAPELVSIRGQSHGKPTDIWALGVTLYYFVYGTCPFLGMSVPAIYERIQNQELDLPDKLPNGKTPSKDLQDLLHRLLTKDPKRRITMKDIRRHPWCSKEFARRPPCMPNSPAIAAPIARVKKTPLAGSAGPSRVSQSLN